MLVEFSLDQKARGVFEHQLEGLRARSMSMRPAFGAVVSDFHDLEQEVFTSQGARAGATWKPLQPWWLEFRLRHGLGTRILHYDNAAGGRLYNALTHRGAPWAVETIDADSVTVGTNLGIAAAHQKGRTVTIAGRNGQQARTVTIPRRRMVQLRQPDKARWRSYVQEYLMSGRVQRGIVRGL